MDRRRFAVALLGICLAALALRVVYVQAVARHDRHFYDAFYYQSAAISLAAGHGVRANVAVPDPPKDADHPPLTAILLAPVAKVAHGSEDAMRMAMAVLGSAVVAVVGLTAAEVGGRRAGLLGAAIAAGYPNLWVNDTLVMAETPTALCVALTILFVYRARRTRRLLDAGLAGLAVGAAMLARGELALLVPLVLVPSLLLPRSGRRAVGVRMAILATIVAALTVSPWVVRNMTTFDRPTFLSTGDGLVLLGANCPQTFYGRGTGTWDPACALAGGEAGDPSVRSEAKRRLAVTFARTHLRRLPVVVTVRLARTWSFYGIGAMADSNRGEGRARTTSLAGVVAYWCLLPVAGYGVVVLRRRGVAVLPLAGPVVLVCLVAAATYGVVRFRVPAEITLVVLAAVGGSAFARKDPSPRTVDGVRAEPGGVLGDIGRPAEQHREPNRRRR